ncbi:MAG: GNAT family N-acetyltransferase [Rhizomicrobium sp.]
MPEILSSFLAAGIDSPAGPLAIRAGQPRDDEFRFALFCASRPELALLPEAVRATVLRQQYRAQTASYASLYPQALTAIVERDGRAIGRIVADETPGCLHIVDIAMTPELRGQGAGGAVLLALQRLASEARARIRLNVSTANPLAQRFYARLGFRETGGDDANLLLEWTPREERC